MKLRALICDIDGVVCDCSERQKKYADADAMRRGDFEAWHKSMEGFNATVEGDLVIPAGVALLRGLVESLEISKVIFVTAREDAGREHTLPWLKANVWDAVECGHLLMRPAYAGVRISSEDLKRGVLLELQREYDVVMALDDHLGICQMYSEMGVSNLLVSHAGIDCLGPAGDRGIRG